MNSGGKRGMEEERRSSGEDVAPNADLPNISDEEDKVGSAVNAAAVEREGGGGKGGDQRAPVKSALARERTPNRKMKKVTWAKKKRVRKIPKDNIGLRVAVEWQKFKERPREKNHRPPPPLIKLTAAILRSKKSDNDAAADRRRPGYQGRRFLSLSSPVPKLKQKTGNMKAVQC